MGDLLIDLICLAAGASLPPPVLLYLALLLSTENSSLAWYWLVSRGGSERFFLRSLCAYKALEKVPFVVRSFKSPSPTEAPPPAPSRTPPAARLGIQSSDWVLGCSRVYTHHTVQCTPTDSAPDSVGLGGDPVPDQGSERGTGGAIVTSNCTK